MNVREPEAWETNASGPFVTIRCERGTVTISKLGADRHRVCAEGAAEAEVEIYGYGAARKRAHEFARDLGGSIS